MLAKIVIKVPNLNFEFAKIANNCKSWQIFAKNVVTLGPFFPSASIGGTQTLNLGMVMQVSSYNCATSVGQLWTLQYFSK